MQNIVNLRIFVETESGMTFIEGKLSHHKSVLGKIKCIIFDLDFNTIKLCGF